MAHGTCRLLALLIKGQPRDLSLITGAAEDWEKVIKGAPPAPAVPWQETDQTNLCSFSCKNECPVQRAASYQAGVSRMTMPNIPVFWLLFFIVPFPYHFSYGAWLIKPGWHLASSWLPWRLVPGIVLSFPWHHFLCSAFHRHFVIGPGVLKGSLATLWSRFTPLGEVSSLSQATHILLPSEAGPLPFLRCMALKIAWLFPNLWAQDWAMFSS